ncbi:hypothetical protein [Aquisalimonas sp.]|uniref:hypothetical protein n=1 Tax=unclassified Aquisalimonas TaxID=2644645 RepID=UPI0025BCD860|nr:hypothetical protein [Aquisalimonas sp.]
MSATIETLSHLAIIIGVGFAAAGLFLRRREIFIPALAKQRMEHVENVRNLAEEVASESYLAFSLGELVDQWHKPLSEIQREDPALWEAAKQVQAKSVRLYRLCKNEKHYLWPAWIDPALVRELAGVLETTQPFTPSAFGKKAAKQKEFMEGMERIVGLLDDSLRRQADRWLPRT